MKKFRSWHGVDSLSGQKGKKIPRRAIVSRFILLALALTFSPLLPQGPFLERSTAFAAPDKIAAQKSPLDTTFNILILGSDQRPDDPTWRTDTIIIAGVDWQNRKVAMVSVPRDLYVDIPEFEKNRINTVDYLGQTYNYPNDGPGLLSQVISDTLGIRVDKYMKIRMSEFGRLIDSLGGVTITLDEPFYDYVTANGVVESLSLPAGKNHLDGETATKYIRYRYSSSDLDRGARQQRVLVAIKNRILELQWLPRIGELWGVYRDMVQTDLGFFDVLRLAEFGSRLDSKAIHGRAFDYSLVYPYTTPGGAQVLVLKSREAFDVWVSTLFEGNSLASGGDNSSQTAGEAEGATFGPPAPPWAYGLND